MRKIVFNILGSLIFFTCLCAGCRKDNSDTNPPQIIFTNPADGQIFTAGDTARVDFSVSDDRNVSSISLVLVDANGIAAMPNVSVAPTGRNASYSVSYSISDLHLNSGFYYFKVIAFDGYNNISQFRKISLTALPRKRLAYYYITRPVINQLQVSQLDSNLVSSPYYTLGGDFAASGISSYNQQILTCGMYSGNVNALTAPSPSLKWSVPFINGPSPSFEGIYSDGPNTYVSFYSGIIKGYDVNGSLRYQAYLNNNYYPIHLIHHSDYLVAEGKDATSSGKKLLLYYASTGTGYQECILNQDVVAFFTRDANNLFVFGNSNNQGVVQVYQVSGNSFWSPVALAPGRLLSAVQVDTDTYLLAHSNGTIYKYIYSTSSVVPFITGVVAAHMAYDDINQELILSQANAIKKYNYNTAGFVNGIAVSDSVCALHVLFNK